MVGCAWLKRVFEKGEVQVPEILKAMKSMAVQINSM